MKQHIFQQLEAQSNLDASSFPPDTALPDYRIPTSLAVVLDSLLHKAAPRIDALPAAVLTDVLEAGIIAWIEKQPEAIRRRLGITLPEKKSSIAAPALSPVPDDEHFDEDDPDPASAQRAADAYMSGTLGYTSMTLHSNFNGGRQGGQGGQAHRKKQHRPAQGQHHGNNGNSGQFGGGHPGGSSGGQHSRHRRRRSGGSRSH